MMCIHTTFSKKTTPLYSTIQNILLAVNPFHCFFCKKLVGREKICKLLRMKGKQKHVLLKIIFYNKYCGKLKIYNGIDLRLSFNSLNLLSWIKILSKILRFLVCDSKLRILPSSNDTVWPGDSVKCLPTSVILVPSVLHCSSKRTLRLMTVERIHPKTPVMLIFIAIFTCLPSCINLSNTLRHLFVSPI